MKESKSNPAVSLIPVIIMAGISLSGLFLIKEEGPSIAGLATILGTILFFVYKLSSKQTLAEAGLNRKSLLADIRKSWLIILMPSLLNVVSVILSKAILPDYVDHVIGRADTMLTLDMIPLMVLQFAVFAFLEEISWRGFMQRQFSRYISPAAAIFVTSLIFGAGHASYGSVIIVLYDVFFVFCNSIFYGIAYHKTKNAYISTIAHFIANFSGALLVLPLI